MYLYKSSLQVNGGQKELVSVFFQVKAYNCKESSYMSYVFVTCRLIRMITTTTK